MPTTTPDTLLSDIRSHIKQQYPGSTFLSQSDGFIGADQVTTLRWGGIEGSVDEDLYNLVRRKWQSSASVVSDNAGLSTQLLIHVPAHLVRSRTCTNKIFLLAWLCILGYCALHIHRLSQPGSEL